MQQRLAIGLGGLHLSLLAALALSSFAAPAAEADRCTGNAVRLACHSQQP